MTVQNPSLEEIKHPETRGRLTGIQEMVLEFDQEVLNLKKSIDERRGVVHASKVIGDRIFQECNVINKKVDDSGLTVEEAKIRIDQIQKTVYIIREIQKENERELSQMYGRIAGLEKAGQMAAKRFDDTRLKFERHERMEADERELDKDFERGPTIEEVRVVPPKSGIGRKTKRKKNS